MSTHAHAQEHHELHVPLKLVVIPFVATLIVWFLGLEFIGSQFRLALYVAFKAAGHNRYDADLAAREFDLPCGSMALVAALISTAMCVTVAFAHTPGQVRNAKIKLFCVLGLPILAMFHIVGIILGGCSVLIPSWILSSPSQPLGDSIPHIGNLMFALMFGGGIGFLVALISEEKGYGNYIQGIIVGVIATVILFAVQEIGMARGHIGGDKLLSAQVWLTCALADGAGLLLAGVVIEVATDELE